eukprot:7612867-Pyramimonas_sp.AAC.1
MPGVQALLSGPPRAGRGHQVRQGPPRAAALRFPCEVWPVQVQRGLDTVQLGAHGEREPRRRGVAELS